MDESTGGAFFRGAPLLLTQGPDGAAGGQGLPGVTPGKVLAVKNNFNNDDRYADVIWLENLELNQMMNGGKVMADTMWRCDQVRAGQLYNRMMFDTKAEAEQFVQKMQQIEPDQMFSIEPVEARQVWN